MLHPGLQFLKALWSDASADPAGTFEKLMPKCACGAKSILACSRCGAALCLQHGYFCVAERDAICVPCIHGDDE